jgi:putative ABC transport system substrate-binding protein
MTFYDPGNAMSMDTLALTRRTAEQLGFQLVERHVGSVEALRLALQSWKPAEADAYFQVSDPRLTSQAGLIIDAALANRVPTMFHTSNLAERGGLASYGQDFRQSGRAAAKHVQRILAGVPPGNIPIENYDHIELVLNLRTARALRLAIPESFRLRADRVID